MLIEQLTQQQLYIRLIAKVLRLSMSLRIVSNMLIPSSYLRTLSNLAETRMDKGFHKDAHLNTLNEQVDWRVGVVKSRNVLASRPSATLSLQKIEIR
jgi:hypothetical protein